MYNKNESLFDKNCKRKVIFSKFLTGYSKETTTIKLLNRKYKNEYAKQKTHLKATFLK